MSVSSSTYILSLLDFYKTCLSIGAVSVRKVEPDLFEIRDGKSPTPSVFMKAIAIAIKSPTEILDKKTNRKKKKKGNVAWIFPNTSRNNVMKLTKVINMWDEYLVTITTNGRTCKIKLIDHMGKAKYKCTIRMYTIKS